MRKQLDMRLKVRSEGRATGDLVQLRTIPYNLRSSLVASTINGASDWNLGLMNQPRNGRVKVRPLRNSVSPTLLALIRAVLCVRTGALLPSRDREWIHM